ncbi:TRAP transporter substrate-binding protein DctP [Nocardioides sp. YIM 152315]|uniref:TRAP transporter substrate-binding protein DctP n=1 Tax=Nocardioides sp. YIM 152315 TaxID=3031760 RepID=UPI0023DA79D7|nr:TRAP transporter substrate-binding protein DctP [Nocardioides sp. YIM 152315]MDF1602221.1 TRAP transporter substrate-binding protein DctP [Nocardioides sp. YIM 152315]
MKLGRTAAVAATFALSACFLTACAEDDGGSAEAATGEGLPVGASMEEYQDALADMDPITLNAQTPAAEGSDISALYENYFDRVTEWSDGKIKFNVSYAYAIAGALDQDNAIQDGRLDIGFTSPVFEPDQYPANAALADSTFIGSQSPIIGLIQTHGAWNDAAFGSDQVTQELEDQGMHVLLPAFFGGPSGIFCAEPRRTADELAGQQTVVSGRVQAAELEALGATPATFDFTEVYEALQRGAADCALNSMRVTVLAGLAEVVPYATFDDEAGFAQTPAPWVINKSVWDGLPLVAQQLLFDQMSGFLLDNLNGVAKFLTDGVAAVEAAGGDIAGLDDASREALQSANEKELENIRSSAALEDGAGFVDALESGSEAWTEKAAELGYDQVGWADFAEWAANNEIDFQPFVDSFFEEVMVPNRPS